MALRPTLLAESSLRVGRAAAEDLPLCLAAAGRCADSPEALERRRFGYRRLHILVRREGIVLNHKKLYRLYREERLIVRKRGGRKRALGTRAPMALPAGAEPTLVFRLRVECAGLRQ
jgi:transposase InsO family protein